MVDLVVVRRSDINTTGAALLPGDDQRRALRRHTWSIVFARFARTWE